MIDFTGIKKTAHRLIGVVNPRTFNRILTKENRGVAPGLDSTIMIVTAIGAAMERTK